MHAPSTDNVGTAKVAARSARTNILLPAALIAIVVLLIWASTPLVVPMVTPGATTDSAIQNRQAMYGQFGDQFGAVNALFSGLAMLGVVLTVHLQIRDSRERADSDNKRLLALEQQAEAAHLATRLAAIPLLLEYEEANVKMLDATLTHPRSTAAAALQARREEVAKMLRDPNGCKENATRLLAHIENIIALRGDLVAIYNRICSTHDPGRG